MTNSLVGDQLVAVVDFHWGPEGGKNLDLLNFSTSLLYSQHCLKKSKIKLPTLVKALLKPRISPLPPPLVLKTTFILHL